MERLTEYHGGVVVIRDKNRHKKAMEVLAKYEDTEERKRKAEMLKLDFPVLRNNNQRKEFLKDFHEWPVWFEVPEADETYYRYNLPDGSSIVICEYKTYQEWKEYYNENPNTLRTELYLIKPEHHYLHDCKTNESAVVEHLWAKCEKCNYFLMQ